MQNTAIYRGEGFSQPVPFVREVPADYAAELELKTEQYMQLLREFEGRCVLPGADEEQLQAEIAEMNDSMLDACARFEQKVNDAFSIKTAQVEFRERTNPILSKSYVINRTRTWPQGHQGDYNTLEIAYKNAPLSAGIGYYLDRYMQMSALAHGVRERIVMLRELLKSELAARKAPRVLDIACGSCREVFELASAIKASAAKFVCVDLDDDALNFSLDRLAHAGLTSDQIELRKYNALRIFDFETAAMEFGLQDVIYSVGYFDYLPDDFLIKLLNSLYKLLAPGGKLIASFKDANFYNSQMFHWLVNWDGFLQRTEDDFERILHYSDIPGSSIKMDRVDSGSIIFYTITKP